MFQILVVIFLFMWFCGWFFYANEYEYDLSDFEVRARNLPRTPFEMVKLNLTILRLNVQIMWLQVVEALRT